MSVDYKQSGVDVEKGDAFVEWIQASGTNLDKTAPFKEHIISGIGGFAAIFQMPQFGFKEPCLVSATDGVGTKVKLAADFSQYAGIGQDLVAMCVNDLICTGARPLFFLDYYATGKLDLAAAKEFLASVRRACHESGCALIGGETAEMPGIYQAKDFDCAGFAVGIVEKSEILGAHRVPVGSQAIGVSSSGFHSNGYSLVRKLFESDLEKWKDKLLVPTHLYPKLVLDLYTSHHLQAVAHITGGGMENIPRVMPSGTQLHLTDWRWPELFLEAQDRSGLSREEMLKTFNCGIGLVLFVEPSHKTHVMERIAAHGFSGHELGRVEKSDSAGEATIVY